MYENIFKIIMWCLLCIAMITLIACIIYDAILSRMFYKHMEEQHEKFMKSLESDDE